MSEPLFIGLLMIAEEADVLEETLAANDRNVDFFYVLDGSKPNDVTSMICDTFPKCVGYTTDDLLPKPPYPEQPRDGYRQHLLEQAYADFGPDNWFLLLHGDEVWTFDARALPGQHPHAGGFVFRLPLYFPRAGEAWDDERPPLEQLRWRLAPGYPEFRMFKGGWHAGFAPDQHFNVTPRGIGTIVHTDNEIRHYPFRSPTAQRSRAARHVETGFDPDNYRHLIDRDEVAWTDGLIQRWQQHSSHYAHLELSG